MGSQAKAALPVCAGVIHAHTVGRYREAARKNLPNQSLDPSVKHPPLIPATPATTSGLDPLPEGSGSQMPYKRIPISFLLQFTDPRNRSIQQHFRTAIRSSKEIAFQGKSPNIDASHDGNHVYTPTYRTDVLNQNPSDPWAWPYDGISMGMGMVEAGPFDSLLDRDFMFSWNWSAATGETSACLLPTEHLEPYNSLDATAEQNTPQAVCLVMERRMDEILSALSRQSTAAAAPLDLSVAKLVFNAARADALLQSYFENWHPHCPILHQPSFDASSVFLPLLVAMLIFGATYLSKISDEAARACLGVVEIYIFEHESFKRLLDPDITGGETDTVEDVEKNTEKETEEQNKVAPLQAAFTISVLLNWHDHHGSQRRVRLHQYTDLVAAARNIGLPSLRHATEVGVPRSVSEWKRFFHVEEAVRLMGYSFLVDSSHVIFHGMPPKLTLSEMTGSLPCSPKLFALARDSPELEAAWRLAFPSPKVASIAKAMSLLMQQKGQHVKDNTGSTLADDLQLFGHLECYDLFVLISGLHEIIFTLRVSCSIEAVKPGLYNALGRWKCLWDWYQGAKGEADYKSYICGGFYENAIEYFWLAKLFLVNDGAPFTAAEPHVRKAFDQDSMEEINAFVKKFAEIKLA